MEILKLSFISIIFLLCSCSKMRFDPKGFVSTKYSVETRFEQSTPKNKSPLRLDTDDYCFWAASDLHIGSTQNVQQFIDASNIELPSFIVFPGDITSGKSHDLIKASELFSANTQVPLYFVAGNHDMYFDSWPQYLSLFGSSNYFFEIYTPNYQDLVIALESGSSTLGKLQMKWLENVLKTRSNYRYCFVFTHANITFTTPSTVAMFPLEESIYLMALYSKYKVNMVIAGHDHRPYNKNFQNVNYIVLPAFVNGSKYVQIKVDELGMHPIFTSL